MEREEKKLQTKRTAAQKEESKVNGKDLQYLSKDGIKKEARKTDERYLIGSYWTKVGRRDIFPIAVSDKNVRYAFMPSLYEGGSRLKIELLAETRIGKAKDTDVGRALMSWWKSCIETKTESELIGQLVNSGEVEGKVNDLLRLLQDESLTPFNLLHDEDRSQYNNANLKMGARIGLLTGILTSRQSLVGIRASIEETQSQKAKSEEESQTQQLFCYNNSSPGGKGHNAYVIADVLTSCLLADGYCDGDYGEDVVTQIIDSLDISKSLKSLMGSSRSRDFERTDPKSHPTVKQQHVCVLFAAVMIIELMHLCGVTDVSRMITDLDVETKAKSERADLRKFVEVLYQTPGSTGTSAQFGIDPLAGIMRYSYMPELLFSEIDATDNNSNTTILFDLISDPSPDSVQGVNRVLLATMYYLMRLESQPTSDRTPAAEKLRNSLIASSAYALDLLHSDATDEEKEAELGYTDIVMRNLSVYELASSSDGTHRTASGVDTPAEKFAGLELSVEAIRAQLNEITTMIKETQMPSISKVEESGKSNQNGMEVEHEESVGVSKATHSFEQNATGEHNPAFPVVPLVTALAVLMALR